MIQSARQKRKKRQDMMAIFGIIGLLLLGGGGAYFVQSNNDPLGSNKIMAEKYINFVYRYLDKNGYLKFYKKLYKFHIFLRDLNFYLRE